MNPTKNSSWAGLLCGCLVTFAAGAQTTIENFEEYTTDADLQAVWSSLGGTISLSPYVAAGTTGTNSLRLDCSVGTGAWDTKILSWPPLAAPMTIGPNQYVSLRIAGDPQFTNASWQQIYLYAYDGLGNFGRWGGSIPSTSTNWQVLNFKATPMEVPWNSPGLPDLNNIVQFAFYIFGQGGAGGNPYSATLYLDDLTIRDTPLVEVPPAAPMRALIDNFESYTDDTALRSAYMAPINSPAATLTTASLVTPAPEGNKALKLAIDFAPGQWPWGALRSVVQAPFSLPTNAVVSLRFKGDASLVPVADDGTVFYLRFYDAAGQKINYTTLAPVTNADWVTIKVPYNQFWSDSTVDTGNLVQWEVLLEGWKGTADNPAASATVYVDDIRVTVTPVLSIVANAGDLTLHMNNLIPGTDYTLRSTTDLSHWTTTTIHATAGSATWPIPAGGQKGFYQLYYTP